MSASTGEQLKLYASFLGASGVGLGAFGAHGLKHKLIGSKMDNWRTAVMYQLVHAVAILSLSALCESSRSSKLHTKPGLISYASAGQCMALGATMFSGSIYLLCLDVGPKKLLGPSTPLGGLLLITGWTLLGLSKKES